MLCYHFGLCLPHLLQLFLHPLVLLLCAPSCWCYCLLGMTHLFELSSTTVSGWLASRTSPTGPQPCCSHPLLVASPIRTWRPLIHVVHSPVHSPSLLCLSVYTITAFISLSCYSVLFKLKRLYTVCSLGAVSCDGLQPLQIWCLGSVLSSNQPFLPTGSVYDSVVN